MQNPRLHLRQQAVQLMRLQQQQQQVPCPRRVCQQHNLGRHPPAHSPKQPQRLQQLLSPAQHPTSLRLMLPEPLESRHWPLDRSRRQQPPQTCQTQAAAAAGLSQQQLAAWLLQAMLPWHHPLLLVLVVVLLLMLSHGL